MITSLSGWLPVDVAPVGLLTWYTPAGSAVAVLTSWLAVINGRPPELRAGCSGRVLASQPFPDGCDFAVNVPAEMECRYLQELIQRGTDGRSFVLDDGPSLLPAREAHAPLLADCALQIECAHGRVCPGDWEPELAGEIVLLHRGGLFLDPVDHPDFCALFPLRAFLPS